MGPAWLSGEVPWLVIQGSWGSSRTISSGFFAGVSIGKTLQSPSLVLMKPRKDMNNESCRHWNTVESGVKQHLFNQSNFSEDIYFSPSQYFSSILERILLELWVRTQILGPAWLSDKVSVKCCTYDPEVLRSSLLDPRGLFVKVSLGKTVLRPTVGLVKSEKDMNM